MRPSATSSGTFRRAASVPSLDAKKPDPPNLRRNLREDRREARHLRDFRSQINCGFSWVEKRRGSASTLRSAEKQCAEKRTAEKRSFGGRSSSALESHHASTGSLALGVRSTATAEARRRLAAAARDRDRKQLELEKSRLRVRATSSSCGNSRRSSSALPEPPDPGEPLPLCDAAADADADASALVPAPLALPLCDTAKNADLLGEFMDDDALGEACCSADLRSDLRDPSHSSTGGTPTCRKFPRSPGSRGTPASSVSPAHRRLRAVTASGANGMECLLSCAEFAGSSPSGGIHIKKQQSTCFSAETLISRGDGHAGVSPGEKPCGASRQGRLRLLQQRLTVSEQQIAADYWIARIAELGVRVERLPANLQQHYFTSAYAGIDYEALFADLKRQRVLAKRRAAMRFDESEMIGVAVACEKVKERFPFADIFRCEAVFWEEEVESVFENRGALKCARGCVGRFGLRDISNSTSAAAAGPSIYSASSGGGPISASANGGTQASSSSGANGGRKKGLIYREKDETSKDETSETGEETGGDPGERAKETAKETEEQEDSDNLVELFLSSFDGEVQLSLDIPQFAASKFSALQSSKNNRRFGSKSGYVFPLTLSLTLFQENGGWDIERSTLREHFALFRDSSKMCNAAAPLLHAKVQEEAVESEAGVDAARRLQTWREEVKRRGGRFPFLIVVADTIEETSLVRKEWGR